MSRFTECLGDLQAHNSILGNLGDLFFFGGVEGAEGGSSTVFLVRIGTIVTLTLVNFLSEGNIFTFHRKEPLTLGVPCAPPPLNRPTCDPPTHTQDEVEVEPSSHARTARHRGQWEAGSLHVSRVSPPHKDWS